MLAHHPGDRREDPRRPARLDHGPRAAARPPASRDQAGSASDTGATSRSSRASTSCSRPSPRCPRRSRTASSCTSSGRSSIPDERPEIEALAREVERRDARTVRPGRSRIRPARPRGDPDALQRVPLVRARRGVPPRPPRDRARAAARSPSASERPARPSSPRTPPTSRGVSRTSSSGRSPRGVARSDPEAPAVPRSRAGGALGVYREVLGSHAPLPRHAARSCARRRARFRALQVEARNRAGSTSSRATSENLEADVATRRGHDARDAAATTSRRTRSSRTFAATSPKTTESARGSRRRGEDEDRRPGGRRGTAPRRPRESATDLVAELGKARLE